MGYTKGDLRPSSNGVFQSLAYACCTAAEVSMVGVYGWSLKYWRGDVFGGVTAAIVALPLALAFGVASGAGPLAGLYGAIAVGFFAALFGGTPAQISGPTGPMTVVMAAVLTQFVGQHPQVGLSLAMTVVMLAGVLQMLFGLLRLGRYLTLVSLPVVSGFMSGIGIIIIILQLPGILGVAALSSPAAVWQALPSLLEQGQLASVGLAAATLALLYGWPKAWRLRLPAPLVALLLGSVLVAWWALPVATLPEVPSGLPHLQVPYWSWPLWGDMLQAALMLAVLGSLDSLLTSLVADQRSRHLHHSDRELLGQGVGNLVAGLLGGLPGAGATMRTVVNIDAGGRTPLSGMVHALVLLMLVLWFGQWVAYIPQPVLAAILLKVGVDIIDWPLLKRARQLPRMALAVMVSVAVLTVTTDLLIAVAVGVFITQALEMQAYARLQAASIRFSQGGEPHCPTWLDQSSWHALQGAQGRMVLLTLQGPLGFAAAKAVLGLLERLPTCERLVIDYSAVTFLDISTALAMEDVQLALQQQGVEVVWAGLGEEVQGLLMTLNRQGIRSYPDRQLALAEY
ncbi:SulP family inorganic anion transporter [Balneatrix alpica]|uniref:SulP family inorganic anion transporter n=1 Tax=Balneatrix alpica TaxID=75684 RepID=UPI00273818CA|nr:SulP family inorganic anion transporter [Balneatrix alpica]